MRSGSFPNPENGGHGGGLSTTTWRGVVAACILAAAGNGCSFLFVQGPPANHREVRQFDCTSNNGLPAVDTVGAVVGGASVLFLLALSSLSDRPDVEEKRREVALLGIPFFALPMGSAVYGFTRVGSCRSAQAELAIRLSTPGPVEPFPAPPPSPSEGAAPSPVQPAGTQWRAAVARTATEVHTAPFVVAPVVTRLQVGQPVSVSPEATNGWRRIALPERIGYVEEAQVVIEGK